MTGTDCEVHKISENKLHHQVRTQTKGLDKDLLRQGDCFGKEEEGQMCIGCSPVFRRLA